MVLMYVRLSKEGCWDGDGGWDVDFGGLAELTRMASFDVLQECRPPETVEEGPEHRVITFVA